MQFSSMKKLFLLGMLIPSLLYAQRFHLNLFGGFSNYSGDLQDKLFTLDESYGSFGIGAQYDLTHNLSVLGNFNYAHVGASDLYNKPSLQPRNLSFETGIYEVNGLLEYNFIDLTRHRFSPYAFAGLALYHFDPFAYDSLGHKVYLQPLSTEGEGLAAYPGQKPYNLLQLAIPFGAGVKLRISDGVVIAYEINFRKLFTDYLDDVSTFYVDQATLLAAKGPQAVQMAYRGDEIKGGLPYPPAGEKRGSPNALDWYYTSGIRVSITINASHDHYYERGSIECPKDVR
jgi:hypothetical protein